MRHRIFLYSLLFALSLNPPVRLPAGTELFDFQGGSCVIEIGPDGCTVTDKPSKQLAYQEKKHFYLFVNCTPQPLDVYYFENDSADVRYASVEAGSNVYVGSYACHSWRVKDAQGAYF